MIEDEIHFLMQCNKYDTLRKNIFDSINATDIVLGSDHESFFIKLLACSDSNIFKATFVHDYYITHKCFIVCMCECECVCMKIHIVFVHCICSMYCL